MPWISTNDQMFKPEQVLQANIDAEKMRTAMRAIDVRTVSGLGHDALKSIGVIDTTAITAAVPVIELSPVQFTA